MRVDPDGTFAAAIGQVHDRAFEGHPEGKRLHLGRGRVGMEPDATLGRATRVVIAATPGHEGFARAVIHADHQPDLGRLPRIFQLLQHVAIDVEVACRLVETGQREDLAVVIAQTVGPQGMSGALGPDQGGDQEPDPVTVHVVQTLEVEDYRSCPVPRLVVGPADLLLRGRRDLPDDVDHPDTVGYFTDVHGQIWCSWQCSSPQFPAVVSWYMCMKSARRVISKTSL